MVRTSGSPRQALTRRRSGVQLSPGPSSTLNTNRPLFTFGIEQERPDLRPCAGRPRHRLRILPPGLRRIDLLHPGSSFAIKGTCKTTADRSPGEVQAPGTAETDRASSDAALLTHACSGRNQAHDSDSGDASTGDPHLLSGALSDAHPAVPVSPRRPIDSCIAGHA